MTTFREKLCQFLFCLAALVAASSAAGAEAASYQNEAFKFSATLPDRFAVCPGGEGQDHGPMIAVETPRPGHCSDSDLKRVMDIFAFYNATDDTRTLMGLREFGCDVGPKKTPCRASKLKLKLAKLRTVVAMKTGKNGEIYLFAVAQNRSGPILKCATGINLIASLKTDRQYYRVDLFEFERLVSSIKIMPDEKERC